MLHRGQTFLLAAHLPVMLPHFPMTFLATAAAAVTHQTVLVPLCFCFPLFASVPFAWTVTCTLQACLHCHWAAISLVRPSNQKRLSPMNPTPPTATSSAATLRRMTLTHDPLSGVRPTLRQPPRRASSPSATYFPFVRLYFVAVWLTHNPAIARSCFASFQWPV